MTTPDDRQSFPIQRWFNDTDWGQRHDDLAALEKRVHELELAWSVKMVQHGEKTLSNEVAVSSGSTPAASVGGPIVPVGVRGPETVIFIYAEFDARATNPFGSASIAVDLFEPTLIPNGLQLARYNTMASGTWYSKLTAPHVSFQDFSSLVPGIGRSPRGERPFIFSFAPEGTYYFELRWRWINGDSLSVRNRRMWVDAQ